MGSSKKTTNSTQHATTSATTTPVVPTWAESPAHQYFDQVNQFGAKYLNSPESLMTHANDLQNQAYRGAASLGSGNSLFGDAANLAKGAVSGPNTITPTFASMPNAPTAQGWNAPQVQNVGGPDVAMAGMANYGPLSQAGTSLLKAQTYEAPKLGPAQGYGVPTLGPASLATGAGVSAPNLDPAAQMEAAKLGALREVQATKAGPAASLLDNFSAYAAPTTQALVDSSLADYDHQAAVDRNRMEAAAGKNRAFGGSGYAIQQAEYDANSNRNRALTAAQLRDNAFARQAGMAESDAGRRQQTSLFDAANLYDAAKTNAGAGNTFTLQDAANRQQAGLANQQATNDRNIAQGQMATQAGIASAANSTQASIANANSQNSRDALFAGLQADAGKFLAGESNVNQRLNADYAARAGEFAANAGNTIGLANQQALNDNARFNSDAVNRRTQSLFDAGNTLNLANAQAQNTGNNLAFQGNLDRARQQAELEAASRRDLAGSQNDLASQAFGMAGQYGLANQDAALKASMFNAQQGDNALARQLQAAGLLGQIGGAMGDSQRADIATQLGAGQSQFDIDQNNNLFPLGLLQQYGSLINPALISAFSGSSTNGVTDSNGTEVTKSSGGLLGTLGGLAGLASLIPGIGTAASVGLKVAGKAMS